MNIEYLTDFFDTYIQCIDEIKNVTDRDDFKEELLRLQTINEEEKMDIVKHFISKINVHKHKIKEIKDMNIILDNNIECFKNVSIVDCWEDIDKNIFLKYFKLLLLISDKIISTSSVGSVVQEMNKKKKKKKNKKNKTQTIGESTGDGNNASDAAGTAGSGAGGGLNSIDDIKGIFKGTSTENLMSNMIDSVVSELKNPKKENDETNNISHEENEQMKNICGMLNLDPSSLQHVFGVAKKIGNQFNRQFENSEVDKNELLKCAQTLMGKLK